MDLADGVSGAPAADAEEYIPATLVGRLTAGPVSNDDCVRWSRQLLSALACLHREGLVHRDVKPSNCLFIGGELKLADFGLLAQVDRSVSRVGTLQYMPPDGIMDTRADVYAAGLVMYGFRLVGQVAYGCLQVSGSGRLGVGADRLSHDTRSRRALGG